jgi:hypothetical protein
MPRTSLIKAALLLLLGINTAIYAATGRISETLEAFAWFTLLLLFELENREPVWARHRRITLAATAFIEEGEWLDAANAWLWIGVVLLLELEIRAPDRMARWRRTTVAVAILLYTALTAVAAAWWLQGEWLDGYDAVLWIAAFVLLEMDLLGRLPGGSRHAPKRR